jgi:Transglutaminase-like superfamily
MNQLDIAGALAKITKMPDHTRNFTVPADIAAAKFRVSLELQDQLLAAGMPNEHHSSTRYFDRTDLLNISLHLDISSRQRTMFTWWARELNSTYTHSISYRMDYQPSCPQPEHGGRCIFSILDPGSARVKLEANEQRSPVSHSAIVTLNRDFPRLPCAIREILDEVRQIGFMLLPATLRWNTEFIWREKVGDCSGVSKILVEKAASQGVAARTSYGLALTPPFVTPHYWAEFLIDDTWVPVDPVVITALLDWGILDSDRWSRYHSIGGILFRMSETRQSIILHNGEETDLRLHVYRAT